MKRINILFQILLLSILALFSIHIIGGLWYYIIGMLFSFKYIEILQNCGILFSTIFIMFFLKKY